MRALDAGATPTLLSPLYQVLLRLPFFTASASNSRVELMGSTTNCFATVAPSLLQARC